MPWTTRFAGDVGCTPTRRTTREPVRCGRDAEESRQRAAIRPPDASRRASIGTVGGLPWQFNVTFVTSKAMVAGHRFSRVIKPADLGFW